MAAMQSHSRPGKKWRRFLRHNENYVLLAVVLLVILAFVAFFTYMLTSPDWRARW